MQKFEIVFIAYDYQSRVSELNLLFSAWTDIFCLTSAGFHLVLMLSFAMPDSKRDVLSVFD